MTCVIADIIIINVVAVIILWQKGRRDGNCELDESYGHKLKINLSLIPKK